MQSRLFRSNIFKIHKLLGFHMAIFFGFMFLSGVVLVFTDELEAVFHKNIWASAPAEGQKASFGTIYDSVTHAFPQSTLFVSQRQPQKWLADRSYVTTGWGEKVVVWSDPSTAEILEVTKDLNFRSVLRKFHDSLFIPRRYGFVLVSATSLVLLSSIVSGLITYRRFWKGLFRFSGTRTNSREYFGKLHRFLAVWTAVFLLLIALTGVYYLTTGLGITGSFPKPPPALARQEIRPAGFDGELIDTAEKVALGALSQFSPDAMVAPGHTKAGIRFMGYSAHSGKFSGSSTVAVDPTNLTVLGVIEPSDFRGSRRIRAFMNTIHFGEWLGSSSRVLWIIFGLASCYLTLSGVRVFLSRTANPVVQRSGTGRFLDGLGRSKWAYLAVILLVAGLAATQFGPLATKWATIQPSSGSSGAVRLQIFGPLREGKVMDMVLSVDSEKAQTVTVQSAGLAGNSQEFNPREQGGSLEFKATGAASENIFIVTLTGEGGETEKITYNLGAAIW